MICEAPGCPHRSDNPLRSNRFQVECNAWAARGCGPRFILRLAPRPRPGPGYHFIPQAERTDTNHKNLNVTTVHATLRHTASEYKIPR